jgi:hypothetical protein
MDHNPFLSGESATDRGEVEKSANLRWQTRSRPPSEYENRLGDALEQVFALGATELPDVVKKLNEMGMATPDGAAWTEARFEAEMAKLGA